MKKILFLFLVLLSFGVNGQNNFVQINGGSLLFRKLPEIQYEHCFKNQRIGLSLGIGYRLPKRSAYLFNTELIVNEDTNFVTDRLFSGFRITPEVKFYLSEKEGSKAHGFYLSIFLRYYNYNLQSNIERKIDGVSKNMKLKSTINSTAFGVAIGTRYSIGSCVTLDVNWLGIGIGGGNTVFTLSSTDESIDWESLNSDFDEAELRFMRYSKRVVLSNGLEAKTFTPIRLVLRSSFSLGLAF
jgi:hypothetical protein